MTTDVKPELASLAAFAWAGLAERGSLPEEALDWLREQSGVEDVEELKKALYGGAACSLAATPQVTLATFDSDAETVEKVEWIRRLIVGARWLTAAFAIRDLKDHWGSYVDSQRHYDFDVVTQARQVVAWCDLADAAIAICRRIEELPA